MSNSVVRRTVWITVAGVWAVLILAVIIQSILGVTVAGASPEASRLIIMMDAAVHGGHVRGRHWRGNGHWVVAEPPGRLPAGTTEMVKLHLELEGDVGEVVRVLRRIGGGDNEGGEVRDGPRPALAEERNIGGGTLFRSRGTTATSAALAPGHWTEELAADFTAGLGRRGQTGDVPSVAGRCSWHPSETHSARGRI